LDEYVFPLPTFNAQVPQLTNAQYAMAIIRDSRDTGKKTPFLSQVLRGVDESLGRPLTDLDLAEENI
jgi:hypothetical protein